LPWLMPGTSNQPRQTAQQQRQSQPPAAQPPGEAKPSPVGPAETPPSAAAPQSGEAPKRSMEQPPPDPLQTDAKGAESPIVRHAAAALEVSVVSSPGGATATLDGNPALACNT